MTFADLAALAVRQLPATTRDSNRHDSSERDSSQYVKKLGNVGILRHHRVTSFEAAIYEPVLILVLQGRKETVLGEQTFAMGPGECLLVSHDLPVIARVTKVPYLALIFDIELATLRDLDAAVIPSRASMGTSRAIQVQSCSPQVLDALQRYVALIDFESDAAAIGPLYSREIHYRLALAPSGGMLRELLHRGSNAGAITRAIAHLRRHFREPFAIAELARRVGMSEASFFRHFKAITASSPIQYRKSLQLLEAQRLLRKGTFSVSAVAFEVGYESAAQFSRDYKRRFGVPPKRDLTK
jgi:AraC-like DNA-binding protein